MKYVAPPRRLPSRDDRCDAISYQELLDSDTRDVPAVLREQSEPDLGLAPVSADHYTSAEFFERSIKKMWMRTWQMACREEDIPNIGDYQLYEVVGKSLIVVRTAPDQIKALHNTCRHRGRKLVTSPSGCRNKFRCPYHAFTWSNNGQFLENPVEWDFPQLKDRDFSLPEAQVGTWGGFVFVNFDLNAPSLESILDPLPRHFERWDISRRWKAIHVAKVVKCNWTIAMEAFIESFHSLATHPQILRASGDVNAQSDVFNDHVSRLIAAKGIPSPSLGAIDISEEDIARTMLGSVGRSVRDDGEMARKPLLPSGTTARAFIADQARKALLEETGIDYGFAADAELSDTITYSLFPNFMVYGGFLPTMVWRFRPVDRDYASSLLEVMILRPPPPDGEPTPRPVPMHLLAENETWADAEELGKLGPILDQDMGNMPLVQTGLEALDNGWIELGRYTECRIRAHHATYDKYMED